MINQHTILGYTGKAPELKNLPNGTPVPCFSVATKKSWKDDGRNWKEKTQWHEVRAFGNAFSKTAERLVKGSLVYVQGELVTREYDRMIKVPNGKKTIEHTIKQLVVELKADTIRILDRPKSNGDTTDAPSDNKAPE
jgi:single-strand DNA-binding protein